MPLKSQTDIEYWFGTPTLKRQFIPQLPIWRLWPLQVSELRAAVDSHNGRRSCNICIYIHIYRHVYSPRKTRQRREKKIKNQHLYISI